MLDKYSIKISHILIGIAILILYMSFLGRHGVLQQTEARYAEVVREMKVSGDFLMPTLNGVPHVQKPPVAYWCSSAAMALFGENEIGARAAPLMAGVGVLLLTAWIGASWFDRRTGLTALLLLAASIEFFALSRSLCADMIMTFWSTAAIAVFAHATRLGQSPSRASFLPYFIFMGIAFATKGPMGIVVPLFVGIGWQLYRHNRRNISTRIPWLVGMLVTLVLALSWFVVVSLRHPELGSYFLKYELVDRFCSNIHGRSEPFWYFFPVLLAAWMPWSPLILPVILRGRNDITRHNSVSGWALQGWLIPPLILLSLSGSKLATYILPLLPGIALWFAASLVDHNRRRSLTVAIVIQMIVFFALGLGVVGALLYPSILPAQVEIDAWFIPLWVISITAVLASFWAMRNGVTLRRTAAVTLAFLAVLTTLASQIEGLAPVMGSSVSLRPMAERIMLEPGWRQAQIIVSGTRGHGIEFYLRRFVDYNRGYADIALKPSPAIEYRMHDSMDTLRIRSASCYVITRKKEIGRGYFPEELWTPLTYEGSFVLLKLNTVPGVSYGSSSRDMFLRSASGETHDG